MELFLFPSLLLYSHKQQVHKVKQVAHLLISFSKDIPQSVFSASLHAQNAQILNNHVKVVPKATVYTQMVRYARPVSKEPLNAVVLNSHANLTTFFIMPNAPMNARSQAAKNAHQFTTRNAMSAEMAI